MAPKLKTDGLARKVNRYLRLKADMKRRYEVLDKLEAQILEHMNPGEVAGNGCLVDNFAESNKCFRAHGINRYEIKPVAA